MQYLREIVNSSIFENIINLPPELKNRKVEVILLPLIEDQEKVKSDSFYGLLSNFKNSDLVKEEDSAWQIAMREKHGNS